MDKCRPESLLSDSKIKVTRQRLTILDVIIAKDSSFCANELFDELKGSIDLVTIYRNLQLFCEAGIVREVMNKCDRQYFEISCVHNPAHPHFYCSSCRKIFCMKSRSGSKTEEKKNFRDRFIIHETVVQYSGICPSCRI